MSDWIVRDTGRDNERECSGRAEAEEKKADMVSLGASPEHIEIIPPTADENEAKADGGTETVEPEVVDNTTNSVDPDQGGYDLPEKPPVDEDPISWMPGSFTDEIEGQDVINRQGYEVMAHYYGIGTSSECEVGPEETDFTFCRVKATATTEDGTEYTAHGSAHVERGDDLELLLEMADTRARKRSLAQATGVGMLAVSELKSDFEGGA